MYVSYDRRTAAKGVSPLVSSALTLARDLLRRLLGVSGFPDPERHGTAMALDAMARAKRGNPVAASRGLEGAKANLMMLLQNRKFPRSERHGVAVVLDLIVQALDSLES